METITANANLRMLLRTGRRHARLSQRNAAELAGVSPAWWKRVESAYETKVATDTLTDMLTAVGVLPEHLDKLGELQVAEALMARQEFHRVAREHDDGFSDGQDLEKYLMAAPASESLRHELIAYVRARRLPRIGVGRVEPFADLFNPDTE
jgi:hypothetical protein